MLEQLLSLRGAAHGHLDHHVAGDVAHAAATFAPVEAVGILVPKHLKAKTSCLRRPVQLAPWGPGPEPRSTPLRIAEERSPFCGRGNGEWGKNLE